MRHGHAEPEAPSDRLRALSVQGESEVARSLSRHKSELEKIQLAVVSPYVRAQSTYQVARTALPAHEFVESELVVPCADPQKLIDYLYEIQQKGVESVLLVSHQPLVGTLVDRLCGLEPGAYRMGTAALAAIDTDVVAANCGELRWLHQAEPA